MTSGSESQRQPQGPQHAWRLAGGLRTVVLAALLLSSVPVLADNAQQKHSLAEDDVGIPERQNLWPDSRSFNQGVNIPLKPSRKNTQTSFEKNEDRSKDVRALATLAPAGGDRRAVRAPPAATSTGGLSSRLPARSLQDWEVEDIVLLATVDGTIHARDRKTGDPRWALEADRPMVETIYPQRNKSSEDGEKQAEDFLWIVEPSQDGSLYGYTPGASTGMQKLGLTVKQLQEMSPYASEDPPVMYTSEKKNTFYNVDVRTGNVLKMFSATQSETYDNQNSCRRVNGLEDAETECTAVGTLTLARTEYTVGIQNKATNQPICTIKYFEWGPNVRDQDLYTQYSTTKDNRYIYSMHDGRIVALDHIEGGQHQPAPLENKPKYRQKLGSPVARVFDIARPIEETSPDTPLIILPQPNGPVTSDDPQFDDSRIFVNCTESGGWYALSEDQYPMITDGARPALSSKDEFLHRLPYLDGLSRSQLQSALVGVHPLTYQELPQEIPMIGGPDELLTIGATAEPETALLSPRGSILIPPSALQTIFALLLVVLSAVATRAFTTKSIRTATGTTTLVEPKVAPVETPSVVVTEPQPEPTVVETEVQEGPKVVRFDEGTKQETDTKENDAAPPSPGKEEPSTEALPSSEPMDATDANETNEDGTPKKRKAHRGKRGGKRLAEKRGAVLERITPIDNTIEGVKQDGADITIRPDAVLSPMMERNGPVEIKNLLIHTDRVLGTGSGGTFVFEGEYDGKKVAVKRMLPQHYELASQEVALLETSEGHSHVIRYICRREDKNFIYLALELCQASIWDLYRDGRRDEQPDEKNLALTAELNSDPRRVLRQLAEGVRCLHAFRIVHRDIKPQNMLIANPKKVELDPFPRLVISDFGLCKTLPDNASTLAGTTGNAGTAGWKAPELIFGPKDVNGSNSESDPRKMSDPANAYSARIGVKRAVDIFSLGCVFYYLLTRGQHPFDDEEGWMQLRERNIKNGRANLRGLDIFGPDTVDLIRWMLQTKPEQRPTAAQVLAHPFFWSAEERLEFLSTASDRFDQVLKEGSEDQLREIEKRTSEIVPAVVLGPATAWAAQATHSHLRSKDQNHLTNGYHNDDHHHQRPPSTMTLPIPEINFLAHLDRKFVETLGRQRKYNPARLVDLLRALRNKYHHWDDMPDDVKRFVGGIPFSPEGYLGYWERKFPGLVVGVWRVVEESGGVEGSGWKWERRFWRFFGGKGG
ncbi:MAG: bifunctional endoribonuclease/protein kinase ire1 [Chrysothrix sp. TS-e1954]|nr:MAG: bifunctional endoribonuclease/protein kinase ire1 [Chrysothrix sp. TS-e1954]